MHWNQAQKIHRLTIERVPALSQALYQNLIEGLGDGLFTLDTEGRITSVNDTIVEKSGRTREWLESRTYLDLIGPEYRDRTREYFHAVLNGKGQSLIELPHLAASGEQMWIRVCATPVLAGRRTVGVFGVVRDLTEHKRMESEFKTNQERLHMLLSGTQDIIVMQDLAGRYTYWNGLTYDGQKAEDLIGKRPCDIIHGANARIVMKQHRMVVSTGQPSNAELTFHENGRKLTFLSQRLPVLDRQGKVTAVAGFVKNITEKKEIEEELTRHRNYLNRLVKERTTKLARAKENLARDVAERKLTEEQIRLERDLALDLAAATSLDRVLSVSFQKAIAASRMDLGSIYLRDHETDDLRMACETGLPPEFVGELSVVKVGSDHWRLITEGAPRYFSRDPRPNFPLRAFELVEGVRSIAIIPIFYKKNVVASINLGSYTFDHVPPASRKILEAMAAQLGNTILRVQTEEALRQSEERYRNIFETAAEGIFQATPDGTLIHVNPALSRIFGYDSADDLRLSGRDIVLQFIPENALSGDAESPFHDRGAVSVVELETSRKDGTRIWVTTHVRAVRDASREVLRYEGTVVDVTERRETEQALKNREAELASKSASLEEANAALRVLLHHRETDSRNLEQKMLSSVKELVLPFLENLKRSGLNGEQRAYAEVIQAKIEDLVSSFSTKLSHGNLTPGEIRVAGLIRDGRTTKEIARLLRISQSAVNLHRFHIRTKFGIKNRKVNLQTYFGHFA
jgi:PAS domain S-box-containing protein